MVSWEAMGSVAAIMAPLVGVPLAVILFHLKGVREQQAGQFADLLQRVKVLEAAAHGLTDDVAVMRRDYATKEEWLRESMWARGQIEKITVLMNRTESELDRIDALTASVERTGRLVTAMNDRMERGARGGDMPSGEAS